MPVLSSAIPVLPVSDIDRLTDFYADMAGFKIVFRDDGYGVLERDRVQIHLWLAGDEDWKTRKGNDPVVTGAESFLAGTASCRVAVDDIDQLFAEMDAAGIVHPNGRLLTKWYGLREFGILDPDNNLVVFFAPAGDDQT